MDLRKGVSNSLILLADDDADDRILFNDAISEVNGPYVFKAVDGGSDLMNYLNEIQNPLPFLIFLDLNMPLKNGFDCLDEIRNSERLKYLIVIIYSTSSQFKDILDTLNKGANLYFTKPSTYHELVEQLKKVLKINWEEYMPQGNLEKFLLSDGI